MRQMLSDDYECVTAGSADDALAICAEREFSLVISDVNLGGMTGVDMVPAILGLSPDTVVMMISGSPSLDNAIDAMRVGVFDYMRKPFDYDHVMTAVKRAIAHHDELAAKRLYKVELESLVEQKTDEIQHISNFDALTGMPNRTLLEQKLRAILIELGPNRPLTVLLACLTNMRAVRHSLGGDGADRMVLEASKRLKEFSPTPNLTARYDDDTFAFVFSDLTPGCCVNVAVEILEQLRAGFDIAGHEIHAYGHIGLSGFPVDGTDEGTVLRNASAALARAQEKGRSGYEFYASEMNAKAFERLVLESNLQNALGRGELVQLYQPKIDFKLNRVVGTEALLRWNSGSHGSVPPDVFIPIAESTGVIVEIGEWVLRTACEQTLELHRRGFPISVAVNLSPRQFQSEELFQHFMDIIAGTGMDPNFLNIEITESSLITEQVAAVDVLSRLRRKGIRVSIDDFGTGHSSLAYLRTLPIDVLKIDKSFVASSTTSVDARTLVETIILMAHKLRLRVVAEGVETGDQLELLRSLGCDEWQGYLHSRPMPPGELVEILQREGTPAPR
jgi:diguanylate cyclase (GGDEF)-like protein